MSEEQIPHLAKGAGFGMIEEEKKEERSPG